MDFLGAWRFTCPELVLEAMGRLLKTGPAAANFDAVRSAGARGVGICRWFGVGMNFVLAGPALNNRRTASRVYTRTATGGRRVITPCFLACLPVPWVRARPGAAFRRRNKGCQKLLPEWPKAACRIIAVAPARLPRLDRRFTVSTGGLSGCVGASRVHRRRLIVAHSRVIGGARLFLRVLLRSTGAGERPSSKTNGHCNCPAH